MTPIHREEAFLKSSGKWLAPETRRRREASLDRLKAMAALAEAAVRARETAAACRRSAELAAASGQGSKP